VKLAWSNLAKAELQELRRYSVERPVQHTPPRHAGEACPSLRAGGRYPGLSLLRLRRDAARRYLEDVRAAAELLSTDPLRAKPLKGPFRIFRVRSHCLILHVDAAADRTTVARVLHVAMDIERHLP